MIEIGRIGLPPDGTPAHGQDIRSIRRKEKGTTLNDAVVLEREKQQRRERQPQEEMPPEQRHEEQPLHVYTADATENDLAQGNNGVNVVA